MSVFGDHDTPHLQPTIAKFDNKPLMKKEQNLDNHGDTLGFASA
jgi:hypothetical protein